MKHVITVLILFITWQTVAAQTSNAKANAPINKSIAIFTSGNGNDVEKIFTSSENNINTGNNKATLNYRVLLGIFTQRIPIDSDYWLTVRSDLSVIPGENGYAYTIGFYRSYADAANMCRSLMQKGYQQATVAAFSDDNVIEIIHP